MNTASIVKAAMGAVLGSVVAEKSAGKGLLGAGLGVIATRLATRSLPGAAIVGGVLIAKAIYDHRNGRKVISPSASTPSLPPATPSRSRSVKPASKR